MSEQGVRDTVWTEVDHELFQLMDAMSDLNAQGTVGDPSPLGVLCLIGETQCGKSTLIKHWAAHHDWRLLTVMPGIDTPEDLGGLPVREGRRLTYTQPSVIPSELLEASWDGKWVLYLDELEKAAPDVLACLLSVLSERRLRDTKLRPAAVVCSMNPSRRPLHEALFARLLCVPYPPDDDYDIWARPSLATVKPFLGNIKPTMHSVLPAERRTTPGSLHRLAHWIDERVFWESARVRRWVIQGSFSETDAVAVERRFEDRPRRPALEWAQTADATDLAAELAYYVATASTEVETQLHDILAARAAEDETEEIARVLFAFYGTGETLAALERWPREVEAEQDVRLDQAQETLTRVYHAARRAS